MLGVRWLEVNVNPVVHTKDEMIGFRKKA